MNSLTHSLILSPKTKSNPIRTSKLSACDSFSIYLSSKSKTTHILIYHLRFILILTSKPNTYTFKLKTHFFENTFTHYSKFVLLSLFFFPFKKKMSNAIPFTIYLHLLFKQKKVSNNSKHLHRNSSFNHSAKNSLDILSWFCFTHIFALFLNSLIACMIA